jgi:acetoin utilization protein AcuB
VKEINQIICSGKRIKKKIVRLEKIPAFMISSKLIKNDITPVMTSFSGNQVLAALDETRYNHLPIVNNQDFLGLICETDLFNNNIDDPIGTYKLILSNAFVKNDNHLYDAVRLVCELKLSLVPVVDNNNVYLGYIDLQSIVEHFGNDLSINNPGSIIELELNAHDYSLSELTSIIESNDIRVLHLGVTTYLDSTKLKVTIKLDKIDISALIQTLNRYEYTISGSYGQDEMRDYLKERYDSLMNYLNL